GEHGDDWEPACEVYLHKTAADYSKATGVPAHVPGHSTCQTRGERVIARSIDLHCDVQSMLEAVLPHETTHVLMAGKFGHRPLTPWANEAMAVLAEPAASVARHLQDLPRYRKQGKLFRLAELVELSSYPDPASFGPYYAQSVSLVEFLTREKGQ